jgi:fatty-acyl-CoA synthase
MRTGDLGFLEDDGGFTYLARMGDELRLGGFLTAPAEIEDYLRTHPMVDGCQVVGADTPSGLGAVGFITLAPGHAFQEALLIEHCRQGLARYKTPARIIPLEDFPVTLSANGTKIQRVKLREMAQAEIKKQGETKK